MTSPSPVVPQLIETNGLHVGRAHRLAHGVSIIGRGSDVAVSIDHEDVSRRHAEIEVGPAGIVVRDLDSKNGVRIDGEPITRARSVTHGQVIALGELRLLVSDPASRVADVLARAGETTMTTTSTESTSTPRRAGLLLPLLGVAIFGSLVAAMLWW
jgi:pSer/pThr/pTyr-binding forkhead associated (FHA) protein